MNVLLFRCANGMVGWRLSSGRRDGITAARCLNDAFLIARELTVDADVVDFLQSVALHSVALRGAVQQVFQVDLPQ